MRKENYTEAELNIVAFEAEDIITESIEDPGEEIKD